MEFQYQTEIAVRV